MSELCADRRIGQITINHPFIEWKIFDYFLLLGKKDQHYYSPSFFYIGNEWHLEICPNGEKKKNVGWTGLYLHKEQSSNSKNIAVILGIRSSDGKMYESWQGKHVFEESKRVCGVANLLPRSEIHSKRSLIAPKNCLTVVCTMNEISERSSSEGEDSDDTNWNSAMEDICRIVEEVRNANWGTFRRDPYIFTEEIRNMASFCKDMRNLLISEQLFDVKICVKGQEFHAHKAVLAARSPVFAAMFEHEMAEKNSSAVDISDCDPDVFKEFLYYLYNGRIAGVCQDNVCALYILADKYDVKQLKERCITVMNCGISVDNFCDMLSLALKYQETELLKRTTDFFVKNAKLILPTISWQSFIVEAPTVANELFMKTLNN